MIITGVMVARIIRITYMNIPHMNVQYNVYVYREKSLGLFLFVGGRAGYTPYCVAGAAALAIAMAKATSN